MIKFLWPFVIIICAIRAILMIVELQRGCVSILSTLAYCHFRPLRVPWPVQRSPQAEWPLHIELHSIT